MSTPEPEGVEPPPRYLLRPAGVLTQLCSASALLLGTIAFVLVQQNKSGGAPLVIGWAAAAMAGLVFGGLMARGGLFAVIAGALLDITFGSVLLAMDWDQLRGILRLLPESDVQMIADVLVAGAVVMLCTAGLCLASIPQARTYARALREAEDELAASTSQAGAAQSFQAMQEAVPPTAGQHGPAGYMGPPGANPTTPYIPAAASTARGWTPNKARTTMMIILPPAEARRSRRRVYIALGGFAIGVGAGIGVLVSAGEKRAKTGTGAEVAPTGSGGGSAKGTGSGTGTAVVVAGGSGDGPETGSGATGSAGSGSVGSGSNGSAAVVIPVPDAPVRTLLATQRELIGKADAAGLAALVATNAFAFGVDAEDVAEGRAAIEEVVRKNLGETPVEGFKVASKFTAVGQEGDHAWTAEELELSGAGVETRRIAITQLVAFVGGRWTVIAQHWAYPVADDTAERLAILGTLPVPKVVPNKADGGGDLDAAVRAAFGTRRAFSEARSEREDGFNFGSGPGERIIGGARIKQLFGRLRSELRLHDGARVVSGAVWDPTQKDAPRIGFAAVNADYTQKTRAATDFTQTFRVLAIFVREDGAWKIVQTQFSNGGPIR